ncbi:hypothetical protein LINPERPRIM_LOCUS34455 [Linum perenne]
MESKLRAASGGCSLDQSIRDVLSSLLLMNTETLQLEMETARIKLEIIKAELSRRSVLPTEEAATKLGSGGGGSTKLPRRSPPADDEKTLNKTLFQAPNSLTTLQVPIRKDLRCEQNTETAFSAEELRWAAYQNTETAFSAEELRWAAYQRTDQVRLCEAKHWPPAPPSPTNHNPEAVLEKQKDAMPDNMKSARKQDDTKKKKKLIKEELKPIKEELSCALCKVASNSEQSWEQHLEGRKHKAKEAALIAEFKAKKNSAHRARNREL